MLAELGIPNTLTKILLKSMILMKASERAKKQEPSFAAIIDKSSGRSQTALLLRPVEEAMKLAEEQAEKRAEQQAIREADELAVPRETMELKILRSKRTLKGKLTSREKRRLTDLRENAARRAQVQEAPEVEEAAVALPEEKLSDEVDPIALPEVEEAGNSSSELDIRSQGTVESSTMKIARAKAKTQSHFHSLMLRKSDPSPFDQSFGSLEEESNHFSHATEQVTPSSSQASSSQEVDYDYLLYSRRPFPG
ncbi:hypothetical protein NW762_010868 [Fusarium torreyae]|uniref:Uncharacterized protein n=1 Tax=Fusarium torreyae TaxID=1237075 RepID=A0A9W8RUM0_9HYPO|nr:hypothetical protein NW762_010868 [Fusarium torreyae]